MKLIFALVLLSTLALAQAQNAPQAPDRVLFDGTSLDGWTQVGPGTFVIVNGAARTQDGMGLLWYTSEKFGNCIIRVEYMVPNAKSNSGVFVRIADRPRDVWFAVHHGYEIQIQNENDEYHRTGAIYSLAPAQAGATKSPGEWNTMEITLDGPDIFVTLNGHEITAFHPAKDAIRPRKEWWEPKLGTRPQSGYIGLQNHGAEDTVWFRKVSVRPLRKRKSGVSAEPQPAH